MPRPTRRVPPQQPQAPQRRVRRRKAGPPPRKPPAPPKHTDMILRVGLTDELIRLTPEGWFKLLTMWVLAGEDVIVRIPKENHEVNIVLRGHEGGTYRIRHEKTGANLPVADVALARDMIRQILSENEDI